ncbi:hypothetical protein J6590_105798 [Homalodisca vitripennis]|nr:hypothetical protein J6590_105798 [Homalodisca vitripennis]
MGPAVARPSGMFHQFSLQAGFQTLDAVLSGGACTSLVVMAPALVADTAPVGTSAAFGYTTKTQLEVYCISGTQSKNCPSMRLRLLVDFTKAHRKRIHRSTA